MRQRSAKGGSGGAQGFADVDPWLDGTLRFGGGYSTWSPPSNAQMGQARPGAPHAFDWQSCGGCTIHVCCACCRA